ncbi:hypothetical protein OS493_009947 [Desmophyllum pertusum]|uniref:Uncharacterized protein n=1 Tax=Desmophyllum pertusum TaxID=174260 RepID=A0A9W9YE90_9CNID|nr:hypothetical protein OS493_009947 [Desmophyllum pertusum]
MTRASINGPLPKDPPTGFAEVIRSQKPWVCGHRQGNKADGKRLTIMNSKLHIGCRLRKIPIRSYSHTLRRLSVTICLLMPSPTSSRLCNRFQLHKKPSEWPQTEYI